MADPHEELLESLWRRRLAWSTAAGKLKSRLAAARIWGLTLSSSGAALTAAAITVVPEQARAPCAVLGAVLLAVATLVTKQLVTVDAVRAWTRARSVSEALKAEVWLYRARADRYGGPDAAQRLSDETQKIENQALDLERYLAAVELPAQLPDSKRPPPPMSQEEWVKARVLGQAEGYYRQAARAMARRLAVFRGVEFGLGLFAAASGAAVAWLSSQGDASLHRASTPLAPWVAVLTTIGGAIAAHIAASRYDFLVMSYHATARRLESLVERWRSVGAPGEGKGWSEFVNACEAAISVENEGWLAKWGEQEPEVKSAVAAAAAHG
ncbi:MAG TPA: DUF4231 domain-containing protein [Anaeromyxobacter sp.]|nr:DUF4231 domain-containing protein [Anaeromyxobacter sp.]